MRTETFFYAYRSMASGWLTLGKALIEGMTCSREKDL